MRYKNTFVKLKEEKPEDKSCIVIRINNVTRIVIIQYVFCFFCKLYCCANGYKKKLQLRGNAIVQEEILHYENVKKIFF